MREGWKVVKIGELGKIVTGNTPPKNDSNNYGGKYPFIKPTDMDVGRRYVTSWEENYSEKAFKKYKNSYIPPKSTGVVTIGTVGEKMFQADQWCFTNQSVNVVIPNKDLYDEDFIFYLMKINLPKVENANPGTASGRHHVSKSNFCAIKVLVPKNKETQRKIASILSGYDDLIENNLKRIKILEEMAQQTYEEWFVRMRFPGFETAKIDEVTGLPEGWEKVKLGDLCEKIFDGTHDSPKPKDAGYKLITGKHLQKGKVDFESAYYISEEDHLKIKKRSGLEKGDIMFSNIGTIGNLSMVTEDFEYSCKNMIVFRPQKDFQYFLYTYLFNENNKNKMISEAAGSTQKFLSLGYIRGFEDVLPSIEMIKHFNEFSKNLYITINNLQNQNQRLREARDILLPRLMMGMVEV